MAAKNNHTLAALRVSDAVHDALLADVESFNASSVADAARNRLELSLQLEGVELHNARSGTSILREAKLKADVEERERKNAVAMGALISKEDVVAENEKIYSAMRQAIQQLPNAITGMSDEQRIECDKAIEDLLTTLSDPTIGGQLE